MELLVYSQSICRVIHRVLLRLSTRTVFHAYFQERFLLRKKNKSFWIFNIHILRIQEKKILKKYNNLLLFLWLFEVSASKKSAWVARVILTLEDIWNQIFLMILNL